MTFVQGLFRQVRRVAIIQPDEPYLAFRLGALCFEPYAQLRVGKTAGDDVDTVDGRIVRARTGQFEQIGDVATGIRIDTIGDIGQREAALQGNMTNKPRRAPDLQVPMPVTVPSS